MPPSRSARTASAASSSRLRSRTSCCAVLEKAGADAHAQAESVARGLGVRLKGVVSATTAGRPVPVQPRMEAMALGEARAAPTPIEPGEATVSATLQATYAIERAPGST